MFLGIRGKRREAHRGILDGASAQAAYAAASFLQWLAGEWPRVVNIEPIPAGELWPWPPLRRAGAGWGTLQLPLVLGSGVRA
jgi:hypothetical protein